MFDRIYSPLVTEQVTNHVNVTEKRAPTDESIKLFHELREKAEKEIIDVLIQGSNAENVLNHVSFRTERDNLRELQKIYVAFELNGQQHKIECSVDRFGPDRHEALVTAVGREILRQIGNHFDVERDLGLSRIKARLKP